MAFVVLFMTGCSGSYLFHIKKSGKCYTNEHISTYGLRKILLSFSAFQIERDCAKSNSSSGLPSMEIIIRRFRAASSILFRDLFLIRFCLENPLSQSAVYIGKIKANSARVIRFGRTSL